MIAFLCLFPVLSFLVWSFLTVEDYDKTINQGYPPGQEIKVNMWTRKPLKFSSNNPISK